MSVVEMSEPLPHWPPGTVAILATAGERPHAIPVSALVRAGPDRILLGLAVGRESLRRLRADPRVSLTLLAAEVAVTIDGLARVRAETLTAGVVGVEIAVQTLNDHRRPAFEIEGAVPWHWTEDGAAERDAGVRAALEALARRP